MGAVHHNTCCHKRLISYDFASLLNINNVFSVLFKTFSAFELTFSVIELIISVFELTISVFDLIISIFDLIISAFDLIFSVFELTIVMTKKCCFLPNIRLLIPLLSVDILRGGQRMSVKSVWVRDPKNNPCRV